MGTKMNMAKVLCGEEETELRLGLPGGGGGGGSGCEGDTVVAARKRGFSETEDDGQIMSLKLNLLVHEDANSSISSASSASSATSSMDLKKNNDKVVAAATAMAAAGAPANKTAAVLLAEEKTHHHHGDVAAKPPAKAQVVGWPPVRSFRKNVMASSAKEGEKMTSTMNGALVKVSIDGAPYLRKVDLKMYKSYQDLSDALGKMFSSFTIGNYGTHGMIDFMNETKLMDLLNGSDYVPTYEDKDGDWMLVGDVPWEMFVESCKRMRIMKGKEAVGLAPRAMEKCKNRS